MVPAAKIAAALGALLGGGYLYARSRAWKAGDHAVLQDARVPSGIPVIVTADAPTLVGSFGVDGSVTVAPRLGDPLSVAAFQVAFPGNSTVEVGSWLLTRAP